MFSRRNSKTVDGTVTNYLLDGNREIAEYDNSGNVLRRYVYGRGVDEVIVMVTPSSGQHLYHYADGLGSVVATQDALADGNLIDQRSYSPYGEGTPSSGTPFAFTGRRYDAETGLYYYRARYYSPALGRFLSPDPKHKKKDGSTGGSGQAGSGGGKAGDAADGESTYAYANNDPINNTDPTGKSPCDYFGGSDDDTACGKIDVYGRLFDLTPGGLFADGGSIISLIDLNLNLNPQPPEDPMQKACQADSAGLQNLVNQLRNEGQQAESDGTTIAEIGGGFAVVGVGTSILGYGLLNPAVVVAGWTATAAGAELAAAGGALVASGQAATTAADALAGDLTGTVNDFENAGIDKFADTMGDILNNPLLSTMFSSQIDQLKNSLNKAQHDCVSSSNNPS